MASWYVYSGAGGSASGADWANAKLTLGAALTAGAAGDIYYVANDHSESTAGALTYLQGTASAVSKVFCVNRAGSVPPVSADLATLGSPTGVIVTTGTNSISINGFLYMWGLKIGVDSGGAGTGVSLNVANANNSDVFIDNCALQCLTSGNSGATGIFFGVGSASIGARIRLNNTTLQFGGSNQSANLNNCFFEWTGSLSGIVLGTAPTSLFAGGTRGAMAILDGVDLTNLSGKTIVPALLVPGFVQIRNCKLPASITIAATPTSQAGMRTDVSISDSAGNTYRQERYQYAGTLTTETTNVRSGGATDGVTPISHKIVTTANANIANPFEGFDVYAWNTVTGSSKTATIEINTAATTLTNGDCWFDLYYLGNSGNPEALIASCRVADFLPSTSTANITSSGATWASGGTAQKMSVTFTAQLAGLLRAKIRVAKASQTLWVDPVLTIT